METVDAFLTVPGGTRPARGLAVHTLNRHPDIKDPTKSTVLMGLWWVCMLNKWLALESELGRWIAHP